MQNQIISFFVTALEIVGVCTHEVLFIDDSAQNVQAAQVCGLTAFQFNSYTQASSLLRQLLESL